MTKHPPSPDETSKPQDETNRTIDSVQRPAESENKADPGSTVDLDGDSAADRGGAHGKTVDFGIDAAIVPDPSRKTTPEAAVDQTVQFDAPSEPQPSAGSKTMANVAVDQTVQFDASSPGEPQPGRKTTPDALDRTIDVDAATPDAGAGDAGASFDLAEPSDEAVGRQVTAVWGEEVAQARPRTTIKGKASKTISAHSTLVIGQREMREPKRADTSAGSVDYDLLNVLGEGGMGVVYSARQASIDRNVAVKMLKAHTALDERQRQKFLSEAVITGDLDHPNIVPIYELGTNHEGALFYSMKRVQGTPWSDRINELSLNENLAILVRVADAMAFAHSRGVIHRDLKPENVMLGDFGEVLVMDWGLAIPTNEFRKSDNVGITGNMGGTPAYMAPEMARGPFERITYASDTYLLGAILFEIVTGDPPHIGNDVMQCLAAAARNQIAPTEKKGELLDVALKAMATSPKDRYASVRDFQKAIREYQSHSESIALTARAEEELAAARASYDYQDYARALFAFQEALNLWEGNERAGRGVTAACADYARCALGKSDFDLGLSLLDPELDEHRSLYDDLEQARNERDARQRRLKTAKRTVIALAALVFVVISVALFAVNQQRRIAVKAEEKERVAREDAEAAKEKETQARLQEKVAREAAEAAKEKEEIARKAAEQAEEQERQAKLAAIQAEEEERKAKARAEYQAYIALIGLAAAKIDENAFGTARELLDECKPELRDWEWGRLSFLCLQGWRMRDAGTRLETVAISPEGRYIAAGGWDGVVKIWQRGSDEPPRVIPHAPTSFVNDLDFSPDGRWLATGSSDREGGYLRLWNVETSELVRRFDGHDDTVLSVRFSKQGDHLLTSSYDNTARLWDVESGQLLQTFVGHDWWVWSARFSPDEKRIVTASHDGTVLIWSVETGQPEMPPFMGHRRGESQAPVYIAEFSPDAERPLIASGGLDNRILLWDPEEVQPFDYEAAIQGQPAAPQKVVELKGHKAAVRCLTFSADGRRLLSGSQDNAVDLWDVEAGALIKTLRGHDGWVRSCAFVQAGQEAISASHDGTVRIWDIDGYEEARVLRGRRLDGHLDAVLAATFSHDGDQVVTASRDRSAKTWDVATGRENRLFREGHEYTTSSAVFFDDGKRLLTSAVDNTTRIWNVATGSELVELRMQETGLRGAAAVSPDGRWVLTGGGSMPGDDGRSLWRARLWDAERGRLVHELMGHESEVTAVAVSPDSQWLFTGDRNGRCVLWDCQSGEQLQQFLDDDQINAAAFLPDGKRLLTASNYRAVRQWQLPEAREIDSLRMDHPDTVASMSVSRDGRLALTSCADGKVRLWDVDTAQVLRSIDMRGGRASLAENLRQAMKEIGWDEKQLADQSQVGRAIISGLLAADRDAAPETIASLAAALEIAPDALHRIVVSVAISPDGTTGLTVAAEDRVVRLWNLNDGREIPYPSGPNRLGAFLDFSGRRGLVWSATFSPDGHQVATVGGDSARLWDLRRDMPAEERELMIFSPHGSVAWADISPDGRLLVTGSWDSSARIWDARTGQTIRKLGRELDVPEDEHQGRVNCAVFSPDGRWVLTSSDDQTAKLWSTDDWQLVRTLRGHTGPVTHGVFSHDGSRIVTSSEDKTARVWETATGEVQFVLEGHEFAVLQAAFSADDLRIVTGSDDNTAIVWDLASDPPQVVYTLKGHTAGVTSVAFSPARELPDSDHAVSTRILTGSEDYTAILWDATTGQEILTLKGHTQEVTAAGFSPDGRLALTGSRDGTAILWLTERWGDRAEIETAGPVTREIAPPKMK